ncbi:MAG: aminotransferase class V-fold PLP-dependent enzyme [Proteobacteria bacterium]|nr:aminotransferase class V-fold PLP-dependent enzyme [Pseudomonadota bacterium]
MRGDFLLKEDVVFLNHGSFGACPREVFEIYQTWQRELEAEPVTFLGRRFAPVMKQARQDLAAYLGADADDLVYYPNATQGLNVVIQSLAENLPLVAGDEILSTSHEYGALDKAWTFVSEPRGVIHGLFPPGGPADDGSVPSSRRAGRSAPALGSCRPPAGRGRSAGGRRNRAAG